MILIQKNQAKNMMTVVTNLSTFVLMPTVPTVVDKNKIKRQIKLRVYPAEGPMLKALAAPFAPVDMVCCLQ